MNGWRWRTKCWLPWRWGQLIRKYRSQIDKFLTAGSWYKEWGVEVCNVSAVCVLLCACSHSTRAAWKWNKVHAISVMDCYVTYSYWTLGWHKRLDQPFGWSGTVWAGIKLAAVCVAWRQFSLCRHDLMPFWSQRLRLMIVFKCHCRQE